MHDVLFFFALLMFLSADLILLFHFLFGSSPDLKADRLSAGTMGLGFLIFSVHGFFSDRFDLRYVLCLAGFFLSYTGFLFSFREKGEENK